MSKLFSKLMGFSPAYVPCTTTYKKTFCYVNPNKCYGEPATGYKYVDARTGEDCSGTYLVKCNC
ncbi:hypothetical protein J6TS2_37060 [Heyndrickxia sporothermodurans]|nr:hypothetical protein J6TS2_37060 [Heyndrickxia sporothermodurans]